MNIRKSKYVLTVEDINKVATVVARLFLGKTLFAYLIKTPYMYSYILCEDYENLLSEYGVPPLDNKSELPRVTFAVPKNFSIEQTIYNNRDCILSMTSCSSNSVGCLFNDGMLYSITRSMNNARDLKELMSSYVDCKYHDKMTVDLQSTSKRVRESKSNYIVSTVKNMKWVEIYDKYLGRVIGYHSLDSITKQGKKNYGGSLTRIEVDFPCVCIAKQDADKVWISSRNIVDRKELEPNIMCKCIEGDKVLLRVYSYHPAGSNEIRCEFKQHPHFGLLSTMLMKDDSHKHLFNTRDLCRAFDLADDKFSLKGYGDNFYNILETERVSGNEWFSHCNSSFIR